MAKQRNSYAQVMYDRFGHDACCDYIQRPPEGCHLYRCQNGHDDCAHYKGGACLKELAQLVEAMS